MEKEKVESGKITSSIIWGVIFYGVVFYLVIVWPGSFLLSKVSNTWIALIINVGVTALYTYLIWRCAVKSTIKKKTTEKENIPRIMKGLAIFLVILIALSLILNFFELTSTINTAKERVDTVTSLYSRYYDQEELNKLVDEQINANLPMLYISLGVKMVIDIAVNILMLRWTRKTLDETI